MVNTRDTVFIWASTDGPPSHDGPGFLWNDHKALASWQSIPSYIEDNAAALRTEYLKFLFEISEIKIGRRSLLEAFEIEPGFSYWWMTLISEKSPLKTETVLNGIRFLALERMLRDSGAAVVVLQGGFQELEDALTGLSEKGNFKLIVRSRRDKGTRVRSVSRLLGKSTTLFGIVFFLRYILRRWPLRKLARNTSMWFTGSTSVTLFSHFVHLVPEFTRDFGFTTGQWGSVPHCVKGEGRKINWFHHFFSHTSVASATQAVDIVARSQESFSDTETHTFFDSFLSLSVLLRSLKYAALLQLKSAMVNRHLEHQIRLSDNAHRWPLLRKDWLESLRGPTLWQNVIWVSVIRRICSTLPTQQFGLFLYEGQPWEYALNFFWRKHNHGNLIALPHSIIPYWALMYHHDPRVHNRGAPNSIPLDCCFAVNGPLMRDSLVESGYPLSLLVEVEAHRFVDSLAPFTKYRPESAKLPTMLILSDHLASSSGPLFHCVENLTPDTKCRYRFLVKFHPAFVEDIPISIGDFFQTSTKPLSDLMKHIDVVLSTPNTAAGFETFCAGVPTVILLADGTLNMSSIKGVAGELVVKDSIELDNLLRTTDFCQITNERPALLWTDPSLPRWRKLIPPPTSS